MNHKGKTALVTGASSGIGLEFARLLAAKGINLVLTARRLDRLDELAISLRETYAIDVETISLDLSHSDAPRKLYERTEKIDRPIDIVINNAGFGTQGLFSEIDWQTTANQIQLNIVALTEITHLFLEPMMKRQHGYILNVASVGAYIPSPYYATYTAGKAYVRNFTEAVSYETRNTGVKISCLCPGPTATEFLEVSGHKNVPPISRYIFMSARRCAAIGLRNMFWGRPNVISGWLNKLGMLLLRGVPRSIMVRISALLMGPR